MSKRKVLFWLAFLMIFFHTNLVFARDWGLIRYVHKTVNMRAKRSAKSKIVGKLKAGEKIKVDFRKDNWYAIFPIKESIRDEKKALGYAYAPLLKPTPLKTSKSSKRSSGTLNYKIVKKEDISYKGASRMVYRIAGIGVKP